MSRKVDAEFAKSKIAQLRKLPTAIPQFFNDDFKPYRSLNQYIRVRSIWWSKNTISTNAQHFREFLNWIELNGRHLEDVSARDIEHYVHALFCYRRPSGKPLAWRTISARTLAITVFLKWAFENQLTSAWDEHAFSQISHSAYRKRDAYREIAAPIKSAQKFLLLEDAVDFINSFEQSLSARLTARTQLMAALMLEVGLRVSEVASFPMSELPEISNLGHSTAARVVGKGNKPRVVLIPNRLLTSLWEYVEIERERILEKIPRIKRNKISTLFISRGGTPVSRNWIEKLFLHHSASRPVKVHPHLLRHTFGTYHYLLNSDLATLTKLMGHSSEETTRDYYVHVARLIAQSEKYTGLQDSIDTLIRIDFG